MKEKTILRFSILIYWTFFWGLSVLDKIIPAVEMHWVGKDFFALFIKFFASLGIKDSLFATIALALIATLESINFVLYLFSLLNFSRGNTKLSEKWFYRGVITSTALFVFFSLGDQVFGDRAQLVEHGLFWMILLASWAVLKISAQQEEKSLKLKFSKDIKIALLTGCVLVTITSISIFNFSKNTFSNASTPVEGIEVVEGVYKFDLPFLADQLVLEKTIHTFKETHPDLELNYIYTGPPELNSKMKTYLLIYLFTDKKSFHK